MSDVLPDLLTADEVSRLLKVPRTTVYYWVKTGTLPAVRVGKHLRFRGDQLAALLAAS